MRCGNIDQVQYSFYSFFLSRSKFDPGRFYHITCFHLCLVGLRRVTLKAPAEWLEIVKEHVKNTRCGKIDQVQYSFLLSRSKFSPFSLIKTSTVCNHFKAVSLKLYNATAKNQTVIFYSTQENDCASVDNIGREIDSSFSL